MELKIKDVTHKSIIRPSIRGMLASNDIKTLASGDVGPHLRMLGSQLHLLSRLVYEKLPEDGGQNNELQRYMVRLGDMMDSLELKCRISGDIDLRIDPSESGFPTVARDLYLLQRDKEKSTEELARIPKDVQLVQTALTQIFQGKFPQDTIDQKLKRQYYETLSVLDLPQQLLMHEMGFVQSLDGMGYFRKSFECLDQRSNLPRFYTLMLKIPQAYAQRVELEQELDSVIEESIGGVGVLELSMLAPAVEAINGIQLQIAERYDIGPMLNRYTENPKAVQALLEAGRDNDSLMLYRKLSVQRESEQPKTGLRNLWNAFLTGDYSSGVFGPTVASPEYVLMPHRLIQKVHHDNINLGPNVKMYGIKTDGGLLD